MSKVANFLAALFQEGYQYNSFNAYRFAISSIHDKVYGLSLGQHPVIVRLLKGVFNVLPPPPVPCYSATWDVQKVLDLLKAGGKPHLLPFKMLFFRMVHVPISHYMAIKVSQFIPVEHQLYKEPRKWCCICSNSTGKTVVPGETEWFFFPSFPGDTSLCPVATLHAYLDKTRGLRGEERHMTHSIWTHCTHGASASDASKAGVTTGDILKEQIGPQSRYSNYFIINQ